jgi:hypothetical protein
MTVDITSVGVATMLFELRTRLFQGHEMDATYHEEVMARYQLTSNPDWQTWFAEERKHVSWGHNTKSTLIYMQTDLVEPQLFLKWVALGQALAGRVPFAVLVWSPSMTARSALASLFHQVLAQRPDVLRSRSAAHYFENITNATTFEDLWDAFRQVLAGLPGFLCYITIPSIGPQEEVFAMRIVDLFNNWSGCSINLQLVTPVHASFPKPDGFIDIDAMYDVSPDLDTPDALHQIVLADLGFPERPSEQLHASLWQSLWRTVCYSVNALAVDALRTVITGCLPASPCSLKSWLQSPACEYHLQNTHLRLCLDQIPFTLPEDSKRRFAASLRDALWSCLGEGEWILPADFDTRKDRPGRLRTRQELWGAMRSVLARHDNAEFLPFAQEVAAMIKEIKKNETDGDVRDEFQRVINEVCAGATWKVACCSVGYAYRAAVEDAINMGLQRTVDCMLGDIVEHPVSSEW